MAPPAAGTVVAYMYLQRPRRPPHVAERPRAARGHGVRTRAQRSRRRVGTSKHACSAAGSARRALSLPGSQAALPAPRVAASQRKPDNSPQRTASKPVELHFRNTSL